MNPPARQDDSGLRSPHSACPRILDVGCGRKKIPGATGVDRHPLEGVDVVHNLEQFPYPFADESFDIIHAHHVIEHLRDPGAFMAELFRIAAAGCSLHLSTPHYSSMGSWRDPTHLHHFSIYTFEYFTEEHPADYYAGGSRWILVRSEIRMLRLWKRTGLEWLLNLPNRFPSMRWFRKTWEEYGCFLFRAREIRVLFRAGKRAGPEPGKSITQGGFKNQ